eukprot:scaffold203_cov145-Skeletonema_marinoi.AAC.6
MPEGTGGGRGRGRGLSRGRGRGRSRRGGRGGGGGNNGNKGGDSTTPTKASSKGNNDSKKPNEQTPTKAPRVDPIEEKMRLMGDQDVLIAFGPFIRAGNQDAVRVHQQYLSNNKQIEFINNARQFLIGQERRANETKPILPVEAKTVAEIEAAHAKFTDITSWVADSTKTTFVASRIDQSPAATATTAAAAASSGRDSK